MSHITAVTSASFHAEVIAASNTTPVLVDFWAPWCGPCRALAPVLEQLARELAVIKIVKLNTDEESEIAGRYAIRSIPAVKLFKNGVVVDEFVGAQPLGAIKTFLQKHLPQQLDPRVQQAEDLVMQGEPKAAVAQLDALPPAMQSEPEVKRVRALAHFASIALSPDETDTIQSARVAAARHLLKNDWSTGVEMLFGAAERNRRYARDTGKDDLLRAFELASNQESALTAARRRLASLLN